MEQDMAHIFPSDPVTDDRIPSSDRPFAIGATDTMLAADPHVLAKSFARVPAIVCHDVIEPALLDRLRARCDAASFVTNPVEGIGLREIEAQPIVAATFCVLLQRPAFLRWLGTVTGIAALGMVKGGISQTRPARGFELDWHDDLPTREFGRRLAITIDISSAAFEGGCFELRRRSDGHVVRFRHDRPGSALIFAVNTGLEHRLLPITDGGPRRVFAGWFHAPA